MYQVIYALARFGGYIASLLLILISVGIVANILSRAILGTSILWMLQAVEYALVGITFFGAAWVLVENKHTKVDVLTAIVPMPVAKALEFLVNVIGLATMSIMTFYSVYAVIDSAKSRAFIYDFIELPEWWTFVLLPVGYGLMAMVFLFRIIHRGRPSPTYHPKSAI